MDMFHLCGQKLADKVDAGYGRVCRISACRPSDGLAGYWFDRRRLGGHFLVTGFSLGNKDPVPFMRAKVGRQGRRGLRAGLQNKRMQTMLRVAGYAGYAGPTASA